jgi:hypothetical protein
MMVARTRDTSRVTWGALLLLAQLLAFGILPSLHIQAAGFHGAQAVALSSAEADAGSTDPGKRHGHDESTCQFCRIADSRYSPAVGDASTVVTRTGMQHAPDTAGSWLRVMTLHPAHGPRPPPLT